MSEEIIETPKSSSEELRLTHEAPLTVDQVLEQVNLIREVIRQVMKEGTHYGIIPGTKERSLYKPGAEVLGVTFRLIPEFTTNVVMLENDHREYRSKCTLRTPREILAGQAEGFCSTMEKKYRWRGAAGSYEPTGKGVPQAYWKLKGKGDLDGARAQIGGPGFTARKNPDTGDWEVYQVKGGMAADERIENPDIADCYNVCLKMAEKRAHTAAILRATGASEMFSQEDDIDHAGGNKSDEPAAKKKAGRPKKHKGEPPAKPPALPLDVAGIRPEQISRIKFLMQERRVDEKTWAWWQDAEPLLGGYTEEEAARTIDRLEQFPKRADLPGAAGGE